MTLPTTDELRQTLTALLTYDASQPLIFSSGLFLFLFAGFAFFYAMLRNTTRLRILYVIAFSLYFYYKSSGWYLLLLIFTAASDYLIAKAIDSTPDRRARQRWAALSVAVNLGMLG